MGPAREPTVLVTGANGFVGRALCTELVRRHYGVRALVRTPATVSLPGCEVVPIADIRSVPDWRPILGGVSAVIHLAGRAHVMRERSTDPLRDFRGTNVEGTAQLAAAAATSGVARMVFVSSIKVNGESTDGQARPFSEADGPAPEDAYGLSKWEAEQVLGEVARHSPLETTVVRPPLVYGPGVRANFLQLLKSVEKGLPLPLATVQNKRDFVFQGNLVDALIRCAEHPEAARQTFLVSDGESVSTPELLRRLAAALQVKERLFPVSPALIRGAARLIGKSAQVDRLLGSLEVDSRKIRSELEWRPPYTLQQGLEMTARWYRERRRQSP